MAVHRQENQEVVGGVGGGATGANQEGSMDVDVGNLDSNVGGREMQMVECDNEDSNEECDDEEDDDEEENDKSDDGSSALGSKRKWKSMRISNACYHKGRSHTLPSCKKAMDSPINETTCIQMVCHLYAGPAS